MPAADADVGPADADVGRPARMPTAGERRGSFRGEAITLMRALGPGEVGAIAVAPRANESRICLAA